MHESFDVEFLVLLVLRQHYWRYAVIPFLLTVSELINWCR